jgi:hypothetical protein
MGIQFPGQFGKGEGGALRPFFGLHRVYLCREAVSHLAAIGTGCNMEIQKALKKAVHKKGVKSFSWSD